MILGSPTGERPDHDDEPAHVTSDDTSDETQQDNAANPSAVDRLVASARTVSEILAPFTGLAASIVHLMTTYQFLKKI